MNRVEAAMNEHPASDLVFRLGFERTEIFAMTERGRRFIETHFPDDWISRRGSEVKTTATSERAWDLCIFAERLDPPLLTAVT